MVTKKERRAAWCDALRSGRYQQGVGCLLSKYGKYYCCLGVAFKVYEEFNEVTRTPRPGRSPLFDGEATKLSKQAQDWFGLKQPDGHYVGGSLAADNDVHCHSFNEIADTIEREPEGLVTDED